MDNDWIPCPRCEGEGQINMEWVGERFVDGSGEPCPDCDGAMAVLSGTTGEEGA